jgi:hypothetical protein
LAAAVRSRCGLGAATGCPTPAVGVTQTPFLPPLYAEREFRSRP